MIEPAIKKLPFIQVQISNTPLLWQQFYGYSRYTLACKRRVESIWRVECRVDSFRDAREVLEEWLNGERMKPDAKVFYSVEDDNGLERNTPLMTDSDWVMAILCDDPQ